MKKFLNAYPDYNKQNSGLNAQLKLIFIFNLILFVFFPQPASAQISPEAEQAFRNTNVRLLTQSQNPRNFTLPLLGGGSASLFSYRGSVVILNFWATWCPPCRAEMPSMENLYRRFKNEGLEILAVDLGENERTVNQFLQNNGFTFPVMLDLYNRAGNAYGIQSIPTSFILDREGRIIARIVGSIEWDTPRMIAAFDALLKSR